jgi:hypothetical protein
MAIILKIMAKIERAYKIKVFQPPICMLLIRFIKFLTFVKKSTPDLDKKSNSNTNEYNETTTIAL